MSQHRMDRINEEVQKELGMILRQVKDPRVQRAMVSITAVRVTPDLKFAKVYYSVLGDADEKETEAGLKSAGGFIRRGIAEGLNLRLTPSLTFIRDRSAENGANIAKLLRSVEEDLTPKEDGAAAPSEETGDD